MGTKKKSIPQEEQAIAARYFTMSNCAVLHLMRVGDIMSEYPEVDGIVQSETGTSLTEELRDWEKSVKKAKEGDYVYDEWQRVKPTYLSEERVRVIMSKPDLKSKQAEFMNQIGKILKK